MSFLFSGHNIDSQVTPIIRKIEASQKFVIANSAVTGIFAFGGWIFPIDAAPDQGIIKWGIRQDSGDSEGTLNDYNSGGDPPYAVMVVTRVSGTDFDFGGGGFVNAGGPCGSSKSGGRWEAAAGVGRIVQRTTKIVMKTSTLPGSEACPGIATIFDIDFDITATFTG